MSLGWYEIAKSKNEQFHFVLKAANGEVVLTSEMYAAKQSAKTGIASVQKNCADQKHFEKKVSTNDKFYFVLKAHNGEIIGSSQMYASEQGRDHGIESVAKNGASTEIKDESK